MKINEAIPTAINLTSLSDLMWIRPLSWRGSGNAIEIEGNFLYYVPRASKQILYTGSIDEYCGEWEVVLADLVIKERSRRGLHV